MTGPRRGCDRPSITSRISRAMFVDVLADHVSEDEARATHRTGCCPWRSYVRSSVESEHAAWSAVLQMIDAVARCAARLATLTRIRHLACGTAARRGGTAGAIQLIAGCVPAASQESMSRSSDSSHRRALFTSTSIRPRQAQASSTAFRLGGRADRRQRCTSPHRPRGRR